MIQPVASGRLFSVYGRAEGSARESSEQEAIARLEEKRRAMLALQSQLLRTRADTELYGESQGDPAALRERLRTARQDYDAARTELAELRARLRDREQPARKQTAPLQSYLEKRAFARDFPDDARLLKTYQIYDSRGNKSVFAASSLEFLGTTVDILV